jgi:two-component system, LuxR family, response regulator FixJ
MKSTPIVHIVDDDEAIRQALSALLSTVAIATRTYPTAIDFLECAHAGMQGCLVADVRMPGMSGLELQQVLKQRGIVIPIIMITGHGDVPMAVRAMKAGAIDFLIKPFNEQDLLDRVLDALNTNDQEGRRLQAMQAATQRFATLTPREREVLSMIMACQHSKGIAYELNISEKTVDVHRYNIMRKTGTRSLSELVQLRLQADETL